MHKILLLWLLVAAWEINCLTIPNRTSNVTFIRSVSEPQFYYSHNLVPPEKQQNTEYFTSSLLKGSIELTKPLSIQKTDLKISNQKINEIEVVIDKYMQDDNFVDWKRESWIKNGLMHQISLSIPCKTSVHSLGSIVGSKNMLIISDQTDWTEGRWSLPQFFQVFLSQGYTKSNVR